MIRTLKITNTPTNTVLLIAYKNSLITTRTTLGTKFGRYRHKALTPPDTKVGKIRLGTMKALIGSDISRQNRGGQAIVKITGGRQSITPKREREAGVGKKGLHTINKSANVPLDTAILLMSIRSRRLDSNTTITQVITQTTLTQLRSTVTANSMDTTTSDELNGSLIVPKRVIGLVLSLMQVRETILRTIIKRSEE